MIRHTVTGAVLLGLLTFCGVAAAVSDGPVVDQFIVRMRSGAVPDAARTGNARAASRLASVTGRTLRLRRRMGSGSFVYALPAAVSRRDAEGILAELGGDPDVLSAEIDERVTAAYVPTDADPIAYPGSLYVYQWPLHNLAAEPFGMDMEDAWDITRGDSASVVAVLDTGILSHEDLNAARILPGYDFISDPATSNDGDGRDPDPSDPGDWTAADQCGQGKPQKDSSWHGLLVTGLIAAEAENGTGIEGIDFHTNILPVRVLGRCGGHVSDIVDAMRWAVGETNRDAGTLPVGQRARVVNLSASTEEPGGCTPEEQTAIDFVRAHGAVVITAAGNESGEARDHSPGNCQGVINVAASTRTGELASYSNFGENVDFVAPGGSNPLNPDGVATLSNGGITIPDANSVYVLGEGTSFSAAETAGVASLIFAVNPSLMPDQVANILCATAQALPACGASTCGKGVLDANGALTLAQMSLTDPTVIPAGSCPFETLNVGPSLRVHAAGGGGGCVAGRTGRVDPLLFVLLAVLTWRARPGMRGSAVRQPATGR